MDIKNKKRIFIFTMITSFICTASHFTFAACNTANAKNGEIEVFVNKKKIKDDDIVYISAIPAMPTMKVKLTGSPSGLVTWTLSQEFIRGARKDGPSYIEKDVPATEEWNINKNKKIGNHFFGGKITIEVKDSEDNKCSFTFHIRGKNPSESTVENYIGTSPWYAIPIAKHESNKPQQRRYYCQFNNPEKWKPSITSLKGGCPNMGDDGNGKTYGWGIFQLTNPKPSIDQLWNWKANVDAGKKRMEFFKAKANKWMNDEKDNGITKNPKTKKPYPGQRVQAYKMYNHRVPIDDDTYGNVTFSDSGRPGTHTFEEGIAIKWFNGGKAFYSWIKDSETEGHWHRNGTDYITDVCAEVGK